MKKITMLTVFLVLICSNLIYAETPAPAALPAAIDPAELAKESEAYCSSTAKAEPTKPQAVIDKINEACALLQKEGLAAFSKFKGKGSPFIFDGTYIWIHDMSGKMLVHPIKNKMEGNMLLDLKDAKGKYFFVIMNNVVKEKGAGWVEYLWPKPGTSDFATKISYVKGCKSSDGKDLTLGCGLYNYSETDLKGLEIK